MPGNPGSSLRCNECRRRKKKCDLQQPHCQRCQKSGLICSGPKQSQPFVHREIHGFEKQTQRQALVGAIRKSWTSNQSARQLYVAVMEHNRHFREVMQRNQWQSVLAHDIRLPTGPLTQMYAAVMNEFRVDKDVGIFSGDRVPLRTANEPRMYSSMATSIRASMSLTSTSYPSLRMATFALLSLYLGRLKGDDGMVEVARRIYTFVLGETRSTLEALDFSADKHTQSTGSWMTGACLSMVLQLFEFLNHIQPGHPSMTMHGAGAITILEHIGPKAFVSQDTKMLLSGFRCLATYQSISERRSTPLTEIKWTEVISGTSSWAPRQALFDIAQEIPHLMNRTDETLGHLNSDDMSHDANIEVLQLSGMFSRAHQQFERWLLKLESLYATPLYWNSNTAPTYSSDIDDVECQPKRSPTQNQLNFLSGPVAGILVTYWSFRLKLWMTMFDIEAGVSKLGLQPLVLGLDRKTLDQRAEETVVLILEAIPYLSSCLEGSIALQYPLEIVEEYHKRYKKIIL